MQILSLIIAAFCFVCLIVVAITRNAGDSIKPLVGGAWAAFIFLAAYLSLRKQEKWERSDDFEDRKNEFKGIVAVGMSTELAEKTMMEKAALVKIYDQHYFGGKYGNRKFRVSEFSGKVSELRFLSLDGKVFEVQAEPKPKM